MAADTMYRVVFADGSECTAKYFLANAKHERDLLVADLKGRRGDARIQVGESIDGPWTDLPEENEK